MAVACISLLQSLINTTNFSTHFELRHTLMEAETSWSKILTEISHRPMFTVFNCRVVSFFAYILFSKTNEGYPLMDMLFRVSYLHCPISVFRAPRLSSMLLLTKQRLWETKKISIFLEEQNSNSSLNYISTSVKPRARRPHGVPICTT